MTDLMLVKPYGLCVQCSHKYMTRESLGEFCPKCGNTMQVLNPADQVVIQERFEEVKPLLGLALTRAHKLTQSEPIVCKDAVRVVKAIENRLLDQWKKNARAPLSINWNECSLLGWWACQELMAPMTYNKGTLLGQTKAIVETITKIEKQYPDKPKLSQISTLLADEVGAWEAKMAAKKSDPESPDEKPLTADDVNAFPDMPLLNGKHAVPSEFIRHVPDAVKMAGKKLVDPNGSELEPTTLEPILKGIEPEKLRYSLLKRPEGAPDIEPGQWCFAGIEETPMWRCPLCKTCAWLEDNVVGDTGEVDPGVECPGPSDDKPCEFKAYLRLEGWEV